MINATKVQIEDFKESILWKDILGELLLWKERAMQEYDSIIDHAIDTNMQTSALLLSLGDINGRRKAVLYFEDILDTLLSIKEQENDSKRK